MYPNMDETIDNVWLLYNCLFWPDEKNWFWPVFKMHRSKARAYIFPATTLQIPALWPTGSRELNGSDPRAGPIWPEPVLRTRAFHLRTDWSDRPDRTNGKRRKWPHQSKKKQSDDTIYIHNVTTYNQQLFHFWSIVAICFKCWNATRLSVRQNVNCERDANIDSIITFLYIHLYLPRVADKNWIILVYMNLKY